MKTVSVKKKKNKNNLFSLKFSRFMFFFILLKDPCNLESAQLIIGELKTKSRKQAEQIMAWKKAYAVQVIIKFLFFFSSIYYLV